MSGLKTSPENSRLLIAHLVEDYQVGSTFDEWPLHITFLPWLMADKEWLIELFRRCAADLRACKVKLGVRSLGPIVMYGDEGIQVREIKESTALGVTHGLLLGNFHPNLQNKDWIGSSYNPHMTVRDNPDPGEDYSLSVDSLSMVEHRGTHKEVIAVCQLVEA